MPDYRRADALERGDRVIVRGQKVEILIHEGPPTNDPTSLIFYVGPRPYTPGGNFVVTLDYRERLEVDHVR